MLKEMPKIGDVIYIVIECPSDVFISSEIETLEVLKILSDDIFTKTLTNTIRFVDINNTDNVFLQKKDAEMFVESLKAKNYNINKKRGIAHIESILNFLGITKEDL